MAGIPLETHDFCTLFDSRYLVRALTLHRSLMATTPSFRLRAYCMDDAAFRTIESLELPNVTPVPLRELEARDPELLEAKTTRTTAEYYWTCTPAVARDSLAENPASTTITYLDADLMFFSDPSPVFEELGSRSILITPHRYSEDWRRRAELRWAGGVEATGIYNVQFMTFRNDDVGHHAVDWWRARCLEWCYARAENGKFGDQKYLDDWPERFGSVCVCTRPGVGLAPWNVASHRLDGGGGTVSVDDEPVVFYHFHELRLHGGLANLRRLSLLEQQYELSAGHPSLVWSAKNPVTPAERELLWEPYVHDLASAARMLRRGVRKTALGMSQPRPGDALRWLAYEHTPSAMRRLVRSLRRVALAHR